MLTLAEVSAKLKSHADFMGSHGGSGEMMDSVELGTCADAIDAHLTSREAKGDEKPAAYRGFYKLVEEMGELLTVLGKLGPFPSGVHPDGAGDLRQRIHDELADVMASARYFAREGNFDHDALEQRAAMKVERFDSWGLTGINTKDQVDTHPAAQEDATPELWIVVKEHAWDHGDGGRPTLAYLWPSEFGRRTFDSFEQANEFIKENQLPIGWVGMKITEVRAGVKEAAKPVVPDELENDGGFNGADERERGYIEGWNACREAMIAAAQEGK